MNAIPGNLGFSIRAFAALIDRSPRTVRRYLASGVIVSRKVAGGRVISRDEAERFTGVSLAPDDGLDTRSRSQRHALARRHGLI